MFFLLPFNLQEVMAGGADAICCGIVGEGSRFCSKLTHHCAVRDHSRKRMFNVMDMEDGFYINDAGVGRAFGGPCLPLAAAVRSPTFKDLVEDGEGKTLETWITIFWHLSDMAKDAKAAASTPLRGGRTTDDAEDRDLVRFYTDLKTPGRVPLDSLNSPKRVKYNHGGMDEDGDDGSRDSRDSPVFEATSATKDARFAHLRTSLALVKGELGTRASDAPYTTIHGGLQGTFTALAAFEEQLVSKASSARVDGLVTDTNACYDKSAEACRAVEQLVTFGSISKVMALEHELREMSARTRVLEITIDRASKLVEDLSTYVVIWLDQGLGSQPPGLEYLPKNTSRSRLCRSKPWPPSARNSRGEGSRWGASSLTGRMHVLPSRGSTLPGTSPITAFPPSCMPFA